MENLKTEITSGFEIIPKNILKSKYSYICKTSEGTKVIQKINATEKEILDSHNIKEALKKNGYPIYDRFYISTQGVPFFEFDGEKYVMMDFKDFKDSDFSDGKDVISTIKATALFHKCSKKLNYEVEKNFDVLNLYNKQLAKFKLIKKNISAKSNFSEFDFIFIKNYDYFYEKAINSINKLEEIIGKEKNNGSLFTLCHNNIKEETAVKPKNGITSLICFENISKGLFISDFSDVINRYLRKYTPPVLNFETILENYFKINHLSDKDVKVLQAMLEFPAKYIKTCCDFYSKGLPFVPNSVVNHLKSIIIKKNIYENYTKSI